MEIIIYENDRGKIAEIVSDSVFINTTDDALDLIVKKEIPTPKKIILHKENINPVFFELRTGLAGEILQKFATYHIQIAIVGDFSNIKSESFQALIRESNRGNQTFFVKNIENAKEKLSNI